jgi:hypothetical protein
MSAPGFNPYARPVPRTDGSAPNPSGEYQWGGPGRYSVPDVPESTNPEYELGGAQGLAVGGSPTGTPDDIRINRREPPEGDPNNAAYNRRRFSDFFRRHSDEVSTVANEIHIQQQKVPGGQNPLWTQERLPTRPTASMHPAGYMFRRPEHRPRPITEVSNDPDNAVLHVSLADHRRNYEIMIQKPQGGVGRNTYRPPIRPWDEDLYTPPPAANLSPGSGIFGGRSVNFRHGG